jgi:hypothetical protein
MSGSDLVAAGSLGMQIHGETLPVEGLLQIERDGGVAFRFDGTDPLLLRARIQTIGERLLAFCGRCDLPVEHEFGDGLYIRRLLIPKGTLIVGRVHKIGCVNVVEQGDIAVLTESGAMRVRTGFLVHSPAGLQKLGYANEDTVFTNIFSTNETDIETLEAMIVCDTHDQIELALEDSSMMIEEGA